MNRVQPNLKPEGDLTPKGDLKLFPVCLYWYDFTLGLSFPLEPNKIRFHGSKLNRKIVNWIIFVLIEEETKINLCMENVVIQSGRKFGSELLVDFPLRNMRDFFFV